MFSWAFWTTLFWVDTRFARVARYQYPFFVIILLVCTSHSSFGKGMLTNLRRYTRRTFRAHALSYFLRTILCVVYSQIHGAVLFCLAVTTNIIIHTHPVVLFAYYEFSEAWSIFADILTGH